MLLKKLAAWLLLAAFILGALSGCTNNTEDILGKVGETPIYRWYYNAHLLNQLDAYKRTMGIDLTTPDKSAELAQYKRYRLDDLAGMFAVYEEARVCGLDQLTSEQEAEVDRRYNEYYDSYISTLMEEYGIDESGRKEAEQKYMDDLKKRTLTPERVRESLRIAYVLELFTVEVAGDADITDEQVRSYYDTALETERARAESEPNWFGENALDAYVYVPEGYIDTIRITVKFTDAQKRRIAKAYQEYAAIVQQQIADMLKDAENVQDGELQLSGDAKEAEERLDAVYEECYAELMPRMEELRNQVLSGADFIKTMEKESDDQRRISYFVRESSSHVEEAYLQAALALKNEGDISPAVRLEDGLCIIQLKERLDAGIRSFEDAYEDIKAEMRRRHAFNVSQSLTNEYFEKATDAQIIELYYDKLP